MRQIVQEADVTMARLMQDAALSQGVLLHHFHSALFAPAADQRYVSRYLVELWATGHRGAHDLFRHMLPTGLLLYLQMPSLSDSERANLEQVETNQWASMNEASANSASGSNDTHRGLASRLRVRIDAAEKASARKVLCLCGTAAWGVCVMCGRVFYVCVCLRGRVLHVLVCRCAWPMHRSLHVPSAGG